MWIEQNIVVDTGYHPFFFPAIKNSIGLGDSSRNKRDSSDFGQLIFSLPFAGETVSSVPSLVRKCMCKRRSGGCLILEGDTSWQLRKAVGAKSRKLSHFESRSRRVFSTACRAHLQDRRVEVSLLVYNLTKSPVIKLTNQALRRQPSGKFHHGVRRR